MNCFRFFRAKSVQIIAFLLILFIFTSSFLLWHLPLAALFNPTLLALVVFVAYLVAAYFRWKHTQLRLEELNQQVAELEKECRDSALAEKEQGDLMRVWSHQMKVPLAAIDLMTQTKVDIDKEELQAQVFQLDNYLNILLETTRIKNVATDFRFKTFSVATLTKSLIKKYSHFFIQKGLSVSIEGDWQLTTDERWFGLALEQLINNSVKYTDKGGLSLHIRPGEISLTDTGMGILAEDLPRLFDHGFTGFNGRIQQQKSSGLGLYLTKLILDKLNFKISVTSQVVVGTTVEIRKIKEDKL